MSTSHRAFGLAAVKTRRTRSSCTAGPGLMPPRLRLASTEKMPCELQRRCTRFSLATMPLQPELHALFDSLQLQIAFQPQTRTINVEVTLVADEPPDRDGETSRVWCVPPGGIEPPHMV